MKKLLFLLLVTACFAATSCNRNYLCTCKHNITGEIVRGNVNAPNGKQARTACEEGNGKTGSYYTCTMQ